MMMYAHNGQMRSSAVRGKQRRIKTARALAAALFTGIAVVEKLYLLSPLIAGRRLRPEISTLMAHQRCAAAPCESGVSSLRVLTLNTAHGRKNNAHQILQKRPATRANLDDIAKILKRERPDIVALQETDGPSVWSGMFDHVEYLAQKADYPYSILGEHVKGKRNVYGTALLSTAPLQTPESIKFSPAPPTFSKGAVISTIQFPGNHSIDIDVVSVHLDFARKSVRKRQAEELTDRLLSRERPLILMGDFNCEWTSGESTLPFLARTLNVKAYRPYAQDLTTYPTSDRRLDWILISPELEFIDYHVFHDTMSDHLGVLSEIGLAI